MDLLLLYSGTEVMSSPSRITCPLSVGNAPAIAESSVDLPAPFEPIMVMNSPSSILKDTLSRAFLSFTVPGRKVLETFLSSSIFSVLLLPHRA